MTTTSRVVLIIVTMIGLLLGVAVVHFAYGADAKPAVVAAGTFVPPPDLGPKGPTTAPAGKPFPLPTEAQFDAGKRTFGNRCARCHGWNMVNLGSIAFDLRKFPHDDAVRFFHDVRYGKNAMPAWKGILTEKEIEAVWAYVRTGGKM
jgi:cytochrome c6